MLLTVRGPLSLLVCALLAALLLAPGAWAQGATDDPMVDPESPAGTEYELPIERARERARGGGSGGSSGSAGEAPLFGEGVGSQTADPLSAGVKSGGSNGGGTSGSRGGGAGSGGGLTTTTTTAIEPDLGTSGPEILRSQAPAPDASGSALIAIGGGALGVLVLGGLAGLALRRRAARR